MMIDPDCVNSCPYCGRPKGPPIRVRDVAWWLVLGVCGLSGACAIGEEVGEWLDLLSQF